MSRHVPLQVDPCWRDNPRKNPGKKTTRYGLGAVRKDKVPAHEVTGWMKRWAAATQEARDE